MVSSAKLCCFVVTAGEGQYANVVYRPSVSGLCGNVAQNSITELDLTAAGGFKS